MFKSQQDALRAAFAKVGVEAVKPLVITDEQRAKVGELMMEWLKAGEWTIREGTRAAAEPLMYVVGKRPTDLIQAWVDSGKRKKVDAGAGGGDKLAIIKAAVEAGLLTKEQAAAKVLELLG